MELLIVPSDAPFDTAISGGSDDAELFLRFRAGDREAFAMLYRTHRATVSRFAVFMTGDPARAEELTQEVFVWLIHHPHAFDPKRGNLAAFLGGVARKLLQREWRRSRRWSSLEDLLSQRGAARQWAAPATDPTLAIDFASLRQAITLLPPKYREAIVLCDLDGKSYEEAAHFLACPVGTVRSRLHRARTLLAQKFQSKLPGRSK